MFPIEIYWEIMTHLPFDSSLKVTRALYLSEWDAYIYHSIMEPKDAHSSLFSHYSSLDTLFRKLIGGKSMSYFKALMKNSSVKNLNDLVRFFLCCSFGDLEEIQLLLRNVDPGEWSGFGIRLAAQYGHVQVVERLLRDERVDPSRENQCALQKATYHGHFEVVEVLINDYRVDPSVWNNYLFIESCKNGKVQLVKRLLMDTRVDPADRQNESIHMAAKYGQGEIVQLLLQDERVDPCSKNNRALKLACTNGHLQVVKILLGHHRVQASEIDTDILFQTFLCKHFEILKCLHQTFNINHNLYYNSN